MAEIRQIRHGISGNQTDIYLIGHEKRPWVSSQNVKLSATVKVKILTNVSEVGWVINTWVRVRRHVGCRQKEAEAKQKVASRKSQVSDRRKSIQGAPFVK